MDAVFIHGFLGDARVWDDVIAAGLPFDRVVKVNLPGVGDSPLPDSWTTADAAHLVANQLDDLGIETAVWIGHSLGGYIVAAAIANVPERVGAAVLAYSSPLPDSDAVKQRRSAEIAAINSDGVASYVATKVPYLFAADDPDATVATYTDQASLWGADTVARALVAIRDRPDSTDALVASAVPTLVLRGEDDGVIAYAALDATNVTEVLLPGGHMGPLTAPQQVAAAITDWFTRIAGILDP